MIGDRPTTTACDPDVLTVLLLDLLAVDIRGLPRAALQAWLRSCAECVLAMPHDHLRVWFASWVDRVLLAWPHYPGGPSALTRDLRGILDRVRQEGRA